MTENDPDARHLSQRAQDTPPGSQVNAAPRASCGVIFAATGARYVKMAENAAHCVRAQCPGLPIHLYADAEPSAPLFDRTTLLEAPWRRSKIDAMIDAPFERNLFLDADAFVVADMSDAFEILDRFDIALAHDQERNSPHGAAVWRKRLPAAFPQFNSGVIVYRRGEAVLRLLRAWRNAVRDENLRRDQGALRELLWESDLRIATLPPEYNLLDMASILRMSGASLAPRVIHNYAIHRAAREDPVSDVAGLLGPAAERAIRLMKRRDRFLATRDAQPPSGMREALLKRCLQIWMLAHLGLRQMRARLPTLRRGAGG